MLLERKVWEMNLIKIFFWGNLVLLGESRHRRNSFDQVSHKGVFIQLPYATPPTVRPPPYTNTYEECPEVNERENWVGTLCGDLNKGTVPLNPMGHTFVDGASYPFEIIKNKTLQFFRHALPVLRNDKSLPKVARYSPYDYQNQKKHHHSKRSLQPETSVISDGLKIFGHGHAVEMHRSSNETESQGRAIQGQWQKNLALSAARFCNSGQPRGSVLCNVYNAMWGKPAAQKQTITQPKRPVVNRNIPYPSVGHSSHRSQDPYQVAESKQVVSPEAPSISPVTPCLSTAEYLTPVFARNHEGAWRYVVQIPREGYFTQTVEVTKCAETQCHFMEGACLTSPRWQSLLVAEMFYPQASFPVTMSVDNTAQNLKRSNENSNEATTQRLKIPSECDGLDEIGCFQVRLFYDWFLIPGSCKCWKRPMDFTRVHQSS